MLDMTKITLEDRATYTYDSVCKTSYFFKYDSTDIAAVSPNFDDANIYEADYGRIIGIELELEIYPETHEYHLYASPTCKKPNGDGTQDVY